MFLTRMVRRFVPDRYFSYDYYSQYIPEKYRKDIDAVVKQFTDASPSQQGEGGIEAEFSKPETNSSPKNDLPDQDEVEKRRQNLVRNFSNDDHGQFPRGYTDEAHEQSLKDSQGIGDFTSNPVNSPAGAGDNVNKNMSQRNFER